MLKVRDMSEKENDVNELLKSIYCYAQRARTYIWTVEEYLWKVVDSSSDDTVIILFKGLVKMVGEAESYITSIIKDIERYFRGEEGEE